jgi:hypothetical protein
LTAITTVDLTATPAVMFSSAEPKLDLTALTARDGVIGHPQDGKRRVFFVDCFPRAVRVFRVAINDRVLEKE